MNFPDDLNFHLLITPAAAFEYEGHEAEMRFTYGLNSETLITDGVAAPTSYSYIGDIELVIDGADCSPHDFLSEEEYSEFIDEVNQFGDPSFLPKPEMSMELMQLIRLVLDRAIAKTEAA